LMHEAMPLSCATSTVGVQTPRPGSCSCSWSLACWVPPSPALSSSPASSPAAASFHYHHHFLNNSVTAFVVRMVAMDLASMFRVGIVMVPNRIFMTMFTIRITMHPKFVKHVGRGPGSPCPINPAIGWTSWCFATCRSCLFPVPWG